MKQNSLKKLLTIGLIYLPLDGINEKGLGISILELTKHATVQNSEKPNVMTSTIIRLVLDKCANVNEAIELFKSVDINDEKYDIDSDDIPGSCYHYLIADAEGNSVVVEFDYTEGFKEIVIKKPEDKMYQICTNHYLSEKFKGEGDPIGKSWDRFDIVEKSLNGKQVTEEDCMKILSDAQMEKTFYYEYGDDYFCRTQWSIVYNLTERTASVCVARNYDDIYKFKL